MDLIISPPKVSFEVAQTNPYGHLTEPVSWKITVMPLKLNRSFLIMVWAHHHKFQTKVNFLFPVNNKLCVTSEGEGA